MQKDTSADTGQREMVKHNDNRQGTTQVETIGDGKVVTVYRFAELIKLHTPQKQQRKNQNEEIHGRTFLSFNSLSSDWVLSARSVSSFART